MAYAAGTNVSPERSIAEIKKYLQTHGAMKFGTLEQEDSVAIAFHAHNRDIRFRVPFPPLSDYRLTETNIVRAPDAQHRFWEQGVRQRYRALLLVIKAKFESIESGVTSFEQEFFPYVVMPGGQTIYEITSDQVAHILETGVPGPLRLEP